MGARENLECTVSDSKNLQFQHFISLLHKYLDGTKSGCKNLNLKNLNKFGIFKTVKSRIKIFLKYINL